MNIIFLWLFFNIELLINYIIDKSKQYRFMKKYIQQRRLHNNYDWVPCHSLQMKELFWTYEKNNCISNWNVVCVVYNLRCFLSHINYFFYIFLINWQIIEPQHSIQITNCSRTRTFWVVPSEKKLSLKIIGTIRLFPPYLALSKFNVTILRWKSLIK